MPTLIETIRERIPFLDGEVNVLAGRLDLAETKIGQLEALSVNSANSLRNLNSRMVTTENTLRNVVSTVGNMATKTDVSNLMARFSNYPSKSELANILTDYGTVNWVQSIYAPRGYVDTAVAGVLTNVDATYLRIANVNAMFDRDYGVYRVEGSGLPGKLREQLGVLGLSRADLEGWRSRMDSEVLPGIRDNLNNLSVFISRVKDIADSALPRADAIGLIREELMRLLPSTDLGLGLTTYLNGLSSVKDVFALHRGFLDKFLGMANGPTAPLKTFVENGRSRFQQMRDRAAGMRDLTGRISNFQLDLGNDFMSLRDGFRTVRDGIKKWRDTHFGFPPGPVEVMELVRALFEVAMVGGTYFVHVEWAGGSEDIMGPTFKGIKGRFNDLRATFGELRDVIGFLSMDMDAMRGDFNVFDSKVRGILGW